MEGLKIGSPMVATPSTKNKTAVKPIAVFLIVLFSAPGCSQKDEYVFQEVRKSGVNEKLLYRNSPHCKKELQKIEYEINSRTKALQLWNESYEKPKEVGNLSREELMELIRLSKIPWPYYQELCKSGSYSDALNWKTTRIEAANENAKTLVRLNEIIETNVPKSVLLKWKEGGKYKIKVKWLD